MVHGAAIRLADPAGSRVRWFSDMPMTGTGGINLNVGLSLGG